MKRTTAPRVELYLTAYCGYCRAAVGLLESRGVAFEATRVDTDPARRREMETRSGRRTVPQIFIGGRHVGGYDDLRLLDQRGELDGLAEGLARSA